MESNLAALQQAVTDLTQRQQAFELFQTEERANADRKFDRIMAMLELLHPDSQIMSRPDKQPMQPTDSTQSPLLATPPNRSMMQPATEPQLMSGRHIRVEVPLFQGEDIEGWLFQMEKFFDFHRIPFEQRMSYTPFYLTGIALTWFQRMYSTLQVHDWTHFVHEILTRFGPSLYWNPEVALNRLRQTTSIANYIEEFETLSARTPGLTPDNLLNRYIAGLKDDIHRELVLLNPQTLSHAMGMSRIAEQKLQETRWSSPRPNGPRPPANNQVSNTPQTTGLPFKRLTTTQMAERRNRGLCFNCDEQYSAGHKCNPKFHCLLLEEEEMFEDTVPETPVDTNPPPP